MTISDQKYFAIIQDKEICVKLSSVVYIALWKKSDLQSASRVHDSYQNKTQIFVNIVKQNYSNTLLCVFFQVKGNYHDANLNVWH